MMMPLFKEPILTQERFLNGVVKTVTATVPKMFVYSKLSKDGTKWFHESCKEDYRDHLIDCVMSKYEKDN